MSNLEAKPGEVVSDGKNVTIGAPVAVAVSVPPPDAANPTPDGGVDSTKED